MIIDSHQHIWNLKNLDLYPWLTSNLGNIYKDFTMEDYVSESQKVSHSILVQASPTLKETLLMLSIANENKSVCGVVGWVDITKENLESELQELFQKYPLLLGLRPMLQDLPDDDYILSKEVQNLSKILTSLKKTFDALVHPRHLKYLIEFIKLNPNLKVVVDHAAKPTLDSNKDLDKEWCENMKFLAKNSKVYVKLSGLFTQVEGDDINQSIIPCIDFLIREFGSKRLIWGSDWPVVKLSSKGSIDNWINICVDVFNSVKLNDQDRNQIFCHNAIEFYNLKI